MRDFIIPEFSQWAGLGTEGHVWGGVDPSLYKRVLSDVRLAGNVYAVRKDASAGAVVITLPSVASQDGELIFSRIDNSANVVAIQPAIGQTFQGVPAGTTHITLRPTGSLRVRAIAAGPARIDWAMPDSASRLWTPTTTDLASVLGWFDARAITGLVEGNDVPSWVDSSGNSRTATQATVANQPIYRATGINNLPAVEAKSGTTQMDTASFTVPDSASFVALMRNPGTIGADTRLGGLGSSGGVLSIRVGSATFNLIHTGVAHMNAANTNPVANATELRSITFDDVATTGNLKYWLNGAADGVQAYAGDVGSASSPIRLFNETGSLALTGFRIAGFVVCTGVISDSNRERIEGALAWRHGVQATNLAAAHLYRNVPPLQAIVQF